jgi:Domain of unknown function (DUF4157)
MSQHDIADGQAFRRQAFRLTSGQRAGARMAARAGSPAAAGGASCRLGDASCATAHASAISRSAGSQRSSVQRSLLRLQRQFGNHFVGRVLREVGTAETDVGGMVAIEQSIDQARGGGQGMDHGTRSRMESAFGSDFSGVRIHTDSRANGLNQSLSARAFATGRDVFFRQGEYNPGTSSGRELLAHELTHVVQQDGDSIRRQMTVSQPGDAHEIEADQMARAVMQLEHSPSVDRQMLGRQEDKEIPLAAKRSGDFLQRQPEAPTPQDEEDKKKLHTKSDRVEASRQADQPALE